MVQRNIWGQLSLTNNQLAPTVLPELSLRCHPSAPLPGVFRWPARLGEDVRRTPQTWHVLRLLAVVAAHITLIWLAYAEIKQPILSVEPPPMKVSMITLPAEKSAPEAEIVPIIKQKPVEKPVVKPIQPPVQKVFERPAPVVAHMVEAVTDTQRFEASTPAAAPIVPSPVAASHSNSTPMPALTPQPEVEEKEEPPKFGVAYLNNPAPEYPRIAKRAGEQGRVLLKVLVNVDGTPGAVELAKSSGYERLDIAALTAVKQWRFEPARKGGKALSAYVMVPLSFSLN